MAEMQFEKADYDAPAPPTCAACAAELRERYYEANGKRVCDGCRNALVAPPPGTAGRRFLGALGWGLLGAFGGFLLYYGVLRLTGYEIGFISIIVGLAVGFGVKKGSHGVGGAGYQALAMGLTYLSIASTYYALLLAEGAKQGMEMGVFGYVLAVPLALALPFLSGFKNLLGLLIIGFGLYEAWKINKRPKLEISGPFEIKVPVPGDGG